jgi:hypothetical protein
MKFLITKTVAAQPMKVKEAEELFIVTQDRLLAFLAAHASPGVILVVTICPPDY